ncbi:DNA polymerase zeta [Chytriomyces hyalinus]|nr:DNA polymerase zeta [Chytriomyces hyalinus]
MAAKLGVRITSIDFAMRVPIDGLDLTMAPFSHPPSKVDRVPVLRVFGATREGQRACVHIHQVLPYLYVPYNGSVDQHKLNQHMYTLGRSLNKSLAIALKIPEHRVNQAQFIAAITLVKGIPFYGFHYSYSHFLKIYVLDPNNMSRVVDLLSRGVVMGQKMQTFESHIPYLPQFFIDHNLLGMDYLRIAAFKFRRPLPPACALPPSLDKLDKPNYFTVANIPDALAWPENAPINRESYCEIELDVVAIDILNRYEIPERPRKPLIQLYNGSEKVDTKLVPSLKGIWEDETKRRANRNLPPTPSTPVPDASQPEPITKDALMNVLLERIENCKRLNSQQQNESESNNGTIEFESKHSFPGLPEDDGFPTAFQAIGAMYFGGEVGNQRRSQSGEEPTPSDLTPSQTAASEKNIAVFVRLSQSASELSERDAEADEVALIDEEILTQTIREHDENVEIHDADLAESSDEENIYDNGDAHADEVGFWGDDHTDGTVGPGNDSLKYTAPARFGSPGTNTSNDSKGKMVVNEIADIENLGKISEANDDYDLFDDDESSELMQQQIAALDAYERQQADVSIQLQNLRQQHGDSINQILINHDSKSGGGASVLIDRSRLDQNDGPGSMTPRGDKRKKELHSAPDDDIEDSDDESKPKIKKSKKIRRTSLDIVAATNPSKSRRKNKSVSFASKTSSVIPPVQAAVKKPSLKQVSVASILKSRNANESSPGPEKQNAGASSAGALAVPKQNLPDNHDNQESRKQRLSKANLTLPDADSFISKVDGMWSSPPQNLESEQWSFFHDPPDAQSPEEGSAAFEDEFQVQEMDIVLQSDELLSSNPISSTSWSLPAAQAYNNPESEENQNALSSSSSPPQPLSGTSALSEPVLVENSSVQSSQQSTVPRMLNIFRFAHAPPTLKELEADWCGELEREYLDPFFSDPADVSKGKTFSNRRYEVKAGSDRSSLPPFRTRNCSRRMYPNVGGMNDVIPMEMLKETFGVDEKAKPYVQGMHHDFAPAWTSAKGPPSISEVKKWVQENPIDQLKTEDSTFVKNLKARKSSQIEGPSQKNKFGYKYSQIQTEVLDHELQHLVVMSVEILTHAMTESERLLQGLPKLKLPDPKLNGILACFYCFQGHDERIGRANGHRAGYHVGAILVEDEENPPDSRRFPYKFNGISGYAIQVASNELELLQALVQKVREFDPDILLGYEVHKSSWGYIIDRALGHYEYDILRDLSRMKPGHVKTRYGREQDEFAYKQTCAMSTTGRMFFNVWRLMRSELTLTTYTLESTAFHVLHQRIPKFTPATLYSWYAAKGLKRWRSLTYYLDRVQLTLDLLDDTSFLSRTCEFAKVYGIDLFSVISRGSQYRVESILSRITRPENFIHVSATKDQVRRMRAIECLPLNMEPVTKFYKDPLAVLDFQSLYPSVMIGYNMCFSTCLGRLVDIGSPKQFGVMDSLNVPIDVVEALKEHLIITQNGVVFVKHYVREGALGRMLKEILETRVMVKASMKMYKGETALMRILEARQLSLKLIANVTYGYAGASFSGRMPCAEIADSIVETGRRALQAGIKLAHDRASEWGGTVVYGDTDSMFVEFPGKSRESAFRIGQKMAHEISMLNPVPMKLKFEKIYHPCILLAKKRYVGFMYETLQDKIPQFDAKGIETVRRDGFPGMAKMVEDSLKLLFRTQDMSQLKAYLYRQWERIMSNRISTIDLIIATEFKLKTYRNLPPGVAMCVQNMAYDKRTEPQGGERIPYVVCEARNTRYSGRSYSPLDLTVDRTLKPDGTVYVRKSIQALSRIFNLIGVDVEAWFNAMPKKNAATRFANNKHPSLQKGGTSSIRGGQFKIDQFYQSNHCILCSEMTINDSAILCEVCQSKRCQESLAQLYGQLSELQRKRDELLSVCRSCSLQTPGMSVKENKCVSVECPVLFVQAKATHEYLAMKDTLEKAISEVTDA